MPRATQISGASLRHAFSEIIWPRRKLVGLGLLLILLNRLSGLVLPASTKYLVDDVIGQGNIPLLYQLLALVGVAVSVQSASGYALTLILSVEAHHLIAELRSQVQRHVFQLPVRLFDDARSGELVSRIMDDVEREEDPHHLQRCDQPGHLLHRMRQYPHHGLRRAADRPGRDDAGRSPELHPLPGLPHRPHPADEQHRHPDDGSLRRTGSNFRAPLLERGRHGQLMAREGRYHQLYTVQARI